MIPIRHLIVMVALALVTTAGAIAAVALIGPEQEAVPAPGAGPTAVAYRDGVVDASSLYASRINGVVSITTLTKDGSTVGGSGFLVDDEGHVLTNEHVIGGANRVTVAVGPRREQVEAKVVGFDAGSDLALLSIKVPKGVDTDPIPLGDADDLRVGDPVMAIGSPFGLDRSATVGIVSALHRQIEAPDGFPIPGAIQTDAAINHGNSGGPLLDGAGRAVGVNTQIAASGVDANVGVAFAVPINIARENIDRWLDGEEVGHAWMGVKAATLPIPLAETLGVDGGVQILQVTPGGPAEKAGLEAVSGQTTLGGIPYPSGGDLLVAADGHELRTFEDLQETLAGASPGETFTLTVLRAGSRRDITLTLRARPAG